VFTWPTLRHIIEPVRLHSADYYEHPNLLGLKTAAVGSDRWPSQLRAHNGASLYLSGSRRQIRVVLVQNQLDASRLPNWTACANGPMHQSQSLDATKYGEPTNSPGCRCIHIRIYKGLRPAMLSLCMLVNS
jgi:hypothetical protein